MLKSKKFTVKLLKDKFLDEFKRLTERQWKVFINITRKV